MTKICGNTHHALPTNEKPHPAGPDDSTTLAQQPADDLAAYYAEPSDARSAEQILKDLEVADFVRAKTNPSPALEGGQAILGVPPRAERRLEWSWPSNSKAHRFEEGLHQSRMIPWTRAKNER